MGKNSAIQWTDNTWNPWRGCHKVGDGCKNCYMYRGQRRYGGDPAAVIRAADATFYAPLKWTGPALVFVCSWSDFFIEEADPWRTEAWDVIRQSPHLTFQIPSKRPENIADRLPSDWGAGWPNVWLGVSVESDRYYRRLDILETIPAALRFVSAEPLLGPLDLRPYLAGGRWHWVITGGESDPKDPRPADPAWFRDIRDQCLTAGIPYFHKQNGGRHQIGDAWGGRVLDGQTWAQRPAILARYWQQATLFA